MQMKSQSPTKYSRENTVPSKSLWGPGSPLRASVSVLSMPGWGRLGWGGRRQREEKDSMQWLCGGDLLCPFSTPPLSLSSFSVFLSLSPFPRPLLLHLSGRGSWSVLLIESIFLWHLSSDWLKDLGRKKTLIKEIISSLEVWQLHFTSP